MNQIAIVRMAGLARVELMVKAGIKGNNQMKIYSCGHKVKTKYKRVVHVPFECKNCELPTVKQMFKKLGKLTASCGIDGG